jgi:hypothetical protein
MQGLFSPLIALLGPPCPRRELPTLQLFFEFNVFIFLVKQEVYIEMCCSILNKDIWGSPYNVEDIVSIESQDSMTSYSRYRNIKCKLF